VTTAVTDFLGRPVAAQERATLDAVTSRLNQLLDSGGFDRLGEPGEPVAADDEHVAHPTVVQLGAHPGRSAERHCAVHMEKVTGWSAGSCDTDRRDQPRTRMVRDRNASYIVRGGSVAASSQLRRSPRPQPYSPARNIEAGATRS
jgi:hypothetical protein